LGETAAIFCSAAYRVTVLALSSLNGVCVPLPSDDRRGAEFIILQMHSISRPPWTNRIFFLLILTEQKIFGRKVKNYVRSIRCHRHHH
jgi:hypothetical protein